MLETVDDTLVGVELNFFPSVRVRILFFSVKIAVVVKHFAFVVVRKKTHFVSRC